MKDDKEISQFFTREACNEGVQLPLVAADGSETEHTITIRGVHSDAFRRAENEAQRSYVRARQLEESGLTGEKLEAAREEVFAGAKLDMVAALVAGWSLPAACTPENVRAFLKEAPQIADDINLAAAKTNTFLKGAKKPSPATPKGSGSSTRRSRTASRR